MGHVLAFQLKLRLIIQGSALLENWSINGCLGAKNRIGLAACPVVFLPDASSVLVMVCSEQSDVVEPWYPDRKKFPLPSLPPIMTLELVLGAPRTLNDPSGKLPTTVPGEKEAYGVAPPRC